MCVVEGVYVVEGVCRRGCVCISVLEKGRGAIRQNTVQLHNTVHTLLWKAFCSFFSVGGGTQQR